MPGYICRKSNLGLEQLVWSRISQYYQVTMARYSHKQHQLQTIWSNYWYSFNFYLDHYSQRCRNTLILLAKIDKRHEKILRVKLWDFNNFLHNLYLLCELYGFHLFLFNLIHEMAEIYKAKMAESSNVLGSFVARKITCPTIHLMLRRLKHDGKRAPYSSAMTPQSGKHSYTCYSFVVGHLYYLHRICTPA